MCRTACFMNTRPDPKPLLHANCSSRATPAAGYPFTKTTTPFAGITISADAVNPCRPLPSEKNAAAIAGDPMHIAGCGTKQTSKDYRRMSAVGEEPTSNIR
jgi:hypothetical protein